MPTVKEVALAADLRCTKCQERVVNVISKIDDWESIVVDVSEKKVTLTRKSVSKGPSKCPVYNRIAQISSQR